MSRSEGNSEGSSVKSLTALAGLRSAIAAHLYFEKLQLGLDGILIRGDNVEELWCLVDWHRYILKSWIDVKEQGHRGPEERWVPMMDRWLNIIDAMVDLICNYALPSRHHQRSVLQETVFQGSTSPAELNLRNMLTRTDPEHKLPVLDLIIEHQRARTDSPRTQELSDGWVDYTSEARNQFIEHQRDASTDSRRMQKPFEKLAAGIRHNIQGTVSEETLQIQRQSGIDSSDFQNFLEEIEEKIKELIPLLTEEEQGQLYIVLEGAFQTALRYRPRIEVRIRYMRFVQSLINTWLPSNTSMRSNLDAKFQQEIQEAYGDVIAPIRSGNPFTIEDLQATIALGADVRGAVHGRDNCSLWAAASSRCRRNLSGQYPIDLFKALVDAGAPYTIEPDENRSPLQAAAECGNIDILAFLLSSKNHPFHIDVNHADASGMTALHRAAAWECGQKEVNILLQHPHVDVNARNG